MAFDWQRFGLILALVLIYATGVAIWTRWSANAKLQGQTIWHVVVGVGGVVAITAIDLGIEVAGYTLVCFAVASVPMAIEYFGRLRREEAEAQKILGESFHVEPSTDREE